MTVTVIVPVYGVEKYIAECAESLFSQTYSDIEYVFCDDCTPDRSIELLREVVEEVALVLARIDALTEHEPAAS